MVLIANAIRFLDWLIIVDTSLVCHFLNELVLGIETTSVAYACWITAKRQDVHMRSSHCTNLPVPSDDPV